MHFQRGEHRCACMCGYNKRSNFYAFSKARSMACLFNLWWLGAKSAQCQRSARPTHARAGPCLHLTSCLCVMATGCGSATRPRASPAPRLPHHCSPAAGWLHAARWAPPPRPTSTPEWSVLLVALPPGCIARAPSPPGQTAAEAEAAGQAPPPPQPRQRVVRPHRPRLLHPWSMTPVAAPAPPHLRLHSHSPAPQPALLMSRRQRPERLPPLAPTPPHPPPYPHPYPPSHPHPHPRPLCVPEPHPQQWAHQPVLLGRPRPLRPPALGHEAPGSPPSTH